MLNWKGNVEDIKEEKLKCCGYFIISIRMAHLSVSQMLKSIFTTWLHSSDVELAWTSFLAICKQILSYMRTCHKMLGDVSEHLQWNLLTLFDSIIPPPVGNWSKNEAISFWGPIENSPACPWDVRPSSENIGDGLGWSPNAILDGLNPANCSVGSRFIVHQQRVFCICGKHHHHQYHHL